MIQQRYVLYVAAAVLALLLGAGIVSHFTSLRLFHKAEQQNTAAVKVLDQAQDAANTQQQNIRQTLDDYARTQQAVAVYSKQIADLSARARALQAERDALQTQIASLDRQRLAQPKLSSLEDMQHALEAINPVYRAR